MLVLIDGAGGISLIIYFLKQSSAKWTAVATGYATAVCVGVRRAGRGLCVSRRLATLCAARMESARRGSVSVTKDGQESTATLVSGLDRIHTHTHSYREVHGRGRRHDLSDTPGGSHVTSEVNRLAQSTC